jgi:perosamine synthetase
MILQYEPLIDPADCERVRRQVESSFVGSGAAVTEFERAVATASNMRHCVATTSGTTALLLALLAIAKPDRPRKILFPAYTFLAGANAARFAGFDVELVDIEPETLCMCPARLNESLERSGQVTAVMYVNHNAYIGPKRHEVRAICDRFEVPLIEDSAQCFGMPMELAGQVGVYSFSVPKLVTTGQGGCVITNDDEIAETVRNLTDHGGNWRKTRIHERIGVNFRFTDILAAYGLSQIERLDRLRELRKQLFDSYRRYVPLLDHGMESAWMVMCRTRDAERLSQLLLDREIQAVQYYRPLHHNPPYRTKSEYPAAEAAYREWLYLPSSLSLTSEQISEICAAIGEFDAA